MKVRDVVIFSGERFEVPQGIQRIDHRATHGWQLRYGGTKLFSDGSPDGSGASEELAMRYGSIDFSYAPQTTKGGLGTPVGFNWNLKTGKVS